MVGLLLLAAPLGAEAQTAAKDIAAAAEEPASPVTAGWDDGFVLQSEDEGFRLQIGLLTHLDGRFAVDDSADAIENEFSARRLRTYLRGRIAERFEFYFNPDFAGGELVVQDAYIDTHFTDAFRVRVGKAKTPFGLERLHAAASLLFFDRALPNTLVPNRDFGVQVMGDVAGNVISYAAGVLNGVTDGASADVDTNDSFDVAGRLVVRPFTDATPAPLHGLGFAMSGSTGTRSELPSFRTASLRQPFFAYSEAVTADGKRTRYSPQVFYYYKTVGAFGEYVHSEQTVLGEETRADIGHDAWQIAGSIVLTGEDATERGVRPRRNFDFGGGGIGAIQVAVRYHTLTIDRDAILLGLADADASRKAEAVTVGVNWYVNPFIKYVFNVERTVFDGDADGLRPAENALVFRTQLAF
ncbi:MAG: OprO/OprP family phosphate-selective porin [Vicinamibacteraceae bacterium]